MPTAKPHRHATKHDLFPWMIPRKSDPQHWWTAQDPQHACTFSLGCENESATAPPQILTWLDQNLLIPTKPRCGFCKFDCTGQKNDVILHAVLDSSMSITTAIIWQNLWNGWNGGGHGVQWIPPLLQIWKSLAFAGATVANKTIFMVWWLDWNNASQWFCLNNNTNNAKRNEKMTPIQKNNCVVHHARINSKNAEGWIMSKHHHGLQCAAHIWVKPEKKNYHLKSLHNTNSTLDFELQTTSKQFEMKTGKQ